MEKQINEPRKPVTRGGGVRTKKRERDSEQEANATPMDTYVILPLSP